MNDWVAEELSELLKRKQGQATKGDRRDLLEKQIEVLWNALKAVLNDALEKLNAETEFKEITGKLRLTVSNPNTIVIRRTGAFPKVALRITRAPLSISWTYIVSNQSGRHPVHVTLRVDIDDNGQPLFVREETLTTDETVRVMLRPFLYPELLDC